MQDEQRADLLVNALANERGSADGIGDPELMALIDLGIELERLGTSIASIEQADDLLRPAFTRQLHATLMAEHPAGARVPAAAAAPTAHAAALRARAAWKRLTLLALAAAAIIAASLAALLHGNQPAFVGTAAVTSTASRPNTLAFASIAHGHAAATPGSGGPPLHSLAPRASALPEATRAKASATGQAPIAPAMRSTARFATPSPFPASDAYGVPQGDALLLPKTLPSLPARAPVYTLHYQALSAGAQAALARDLLGPNAVPQDGGTTTRNGNSLTMIASTGEVTLVAAARPVTARRPIDTSAASSLALQWIRAHGLFPPSLLAAGTKQTISGSNITVRFTPALPHAIDSGGTRFEVAVTIDAAGRVTHAHRLWPQFVPGRETALVGLAAAATRLQAAAVPSAGGAPKSTQTAGQRNLRVVSATVVYVPVPTAAGSMLMPYYKLQTKGAGARSITTILLPATSTQP